MTMRVEVSLPSISSSAATTVRPSGSVRRGQRVEEPGQAPTAASTGVRPAAAAFSAGPQLAQAGLVELGHLERALLDPVRWR